MGYNRRGKLPPAGTGPADNAREEAEMAKTYLANAFSLNMVQLPCTIKAEEAKAEEVAAVDFVSAVGHEATAAVLTKKLGKEVPANRMVVSLASGDVLYVTALFKEGKPYRPPEGKVLSEQELDQLEMKLVKVTVL